MFTVSEIMKKDLLKGKAPYVRNGQLYFDQITISKSGCKLYNKTKLVAMAEFNPASFTKGDTVTFILTEGKMKIKLV